MPLKRDDVAFVAKTIVNSIGDSITIEQAMKLLRTRCGIRLVASQWMDLGGNKFILEFEFEGGHGSETSTTDA